MTQDLRSGSGGVGLGAAAQHRTPARSVTPTSLPHPAALRQQGATSSSAGNSRPSTPNELLPERRSTGSTDGRQSRGAGSRRTGSATQPSHRGSKGSGVISSALDYKQFVDQRRHMIQQLVESAQQSAHPGITSDAGQDDKRQRSDSAAFQDAAQSTGGSSTPNRKVSNGFRAFDAGALAQQQQHQPQARASTPQDHLARTHVRSTEGSSAKVGIRPQTPLVGERVEGAHRDAKEVEGSDGNKHGDAAVDVAAAETNAAEGDAKGYLASHSLEDYVLGKHIGQGAYAMVFQGMHRDSAQKVAVKIYEKSKLLDAQRRKSVQCEIRLMERLRHPNIVAFHDALDTAKHIYIIMEYLGGGSLYHLLKKRPSRHLDDNVAKRVFFQICHGVKYLHDRHVVHRDIKLENLLLNDWGTVKIIDFGFSTVVPPGKRLRVFCGTPSYMAPEIVARREYSGFGADIWAMGVLLHALLCGCFPFRGANDRDLYRKILRGVFHLPDTVSPGPKALLIRILTIDMASRPTVNDVLKDNWFSAHKDDLYTGKGAAYSFYQPNASTSSTATTAAPSSSFQTQVTQEMLSGENQLGAGSATRAWSRCQSATSLPQARQMMSGDGHAPGPDSQHPPRPSTQQEARRDPAAGSQVSPDAESGGQQPITSPRRALEKLLKGEASSAAEQEALRKLERLGYSHEDLARQLQDESSHPYKLYMRFLKTLSAWDSKT